MPVERRIHRACVMTGRHDATYVRAIRDVPELRGQVRPSLSAISRAIFDVAGSYQTAFTTFLGLYVLAAIVIMGFRERS